MTELQVTKRRPTSRAKAATGRLFVLELSGDRIHSMNLDGSDRKTIVTDCHFPDGKALCSQSAPRLGSHPRRRQNAHPAAGIRRMPRAFHVRQRANRGAMAAGE